MSVKIKYLKGEYTDQEIIELMRGIKEIKNCSIYEFKSFGQMLKAKLSAKDLTREKIIKLFRNKP